MANIYSSKGVAISVSADPASDMDRNVKGIAHRGLSYSAPENTLPAYRLAKRAGFVYVETDVSFTADGVAVCLHDETVDRTSDGTGSIGELTLAQVKAMDFGSWKSSDYAGTEIPTLEEFLLCCRSLGLHPYIELKNNGDYTEAQIQGLVDLVQACGMQGKVTWISYSETYLGYVHSYDAAARLGFIISEIGPGAVSKAQALKSGNEVFIDANVSHITTESIALCIAAGIPVEVWTVDSAASMAAVNPYVTGIASNKLVAGRVLMEAELEGE